MSIYDEVVAIKSNNKYIFQQNAFYILHQLSVIMNACIYISELFQVSSKPKYITLNNDAMSG